MPLLSQVLLEVEAHGRAYVHCSGDMWAVTRLKPVRIMGSVKDTVASSAAAARQLLKGSGGYSTAGSPPRPAAGCLASAAATTPAGRPSSAPPHVYGKPPWMPTSAKPCTPPPAAAQGSQYFPTLRGLQSSGSSGVSAWLADVASILDGGRGRQRAAAVSAQPVFTPSPAPAP